MESMVWASLLKRLSGKGDPDKQNRMTGFAPIFRSDFTPSTPRNVFIPHLHTFIHARKYTAGKQQVAIMAANTDAVFLSFNMI